MKLKNRSLYTCIKDTERVLSIAYGAVTIGLCMCKSPEESIEDDIQRGIVSIIMVKLTAYAILRYYTYFAPNFQMLAAVKRKDLPAVQQAIADGAQLDYEQGFAVERAIQNKDVKIAELFLQDSDFLNVSNDPLGVLESAVLQKCDGIVQLLLRQSALVEQRDYRDAYHHAAKRYALNTLKQLLQHKPLDFEKFYSLSEKFIQEGDEQAALILAAGMCWLQQGRERVLPELRPMIWSRLNQPACEIGHLLQASLPETARLVVTQYLSFTGDVTAIDLRRFDNKLLMLNVPL